VAGTTAHCVGRYGPTLIDLTLLGDAEPGEWLLTALGVARDRLTVEDALALDRALQALEALDDPNFDVATYFPDLVDREPPRPVAVEEPGS
jgi:hydrogenase expression/formation protein HypC